MRKLQLIIVALSLMAAAAAAQSPAKILKDAERALGGGKALGRITSVEKRGKITRLADGAAGTVLIQTQRPNLYNISFDIAGFEIESGYNGKSAWTRDSRSGLQTLTGDRSADFHTEATFRNSLWLDAKREKAKLVSGGKAAVAGRPANVVLMTAAKGSKIKLFFDEISKLPVREEFEAGAKTFEYSDYRLVNGVMQPHRVRMEIDGAVYEARFDEIRPNAILARTEFDFPKLSGEPLPDIPQLLKELQANEEKVENILDTYSYIQKRTRREIGKDGVLRETSSETFQLSFYEGHRISRLIEKNGKPLSASD